MLCRGTGRARRRVKNAKNAARASARTRSHRTRGAAPPLLLWAAPSRNKHSSLSSFGQPAARRPPRLKCSSSPRGLPRSSLRLSRSPDLERTMAGREEARPVTRVTGKIVVIPKGQQTRDHASVAAWTSTSELGYCGETCVNLHARHRADAVPGTTSRRRRGAPEFDFHAGPSARWCGSSRTTAARIARWRTPSACSTRR